MKPSTLLICSIALTTTSGTVAAQEAWNFTQSDKGPELAVGDLLLRPILIEGDKSNGATLGLDYEFSKSFKKVQGFGDVGQDEISPDGTRKEYVGNISARGTVAASKERNPNNFMDFSASYSFARKSGPSYFLAGAKAKFETDQGFEEKQYVLGLSATYTYLFENMSFLGITAGLGKVNPNEDKARQAVLGSSLANYNRADFELFYMIPLTFPTMPLASLEINYRHYQELNSPSAISAAGIHRHRFGLIRLNLNDNLFVQFGKGKLPFDTDSERVVKVGWTYNFK